MKKIKILYIIPALIFVFSCSSKKNVIYLQDLEVLKDYSVEYKQYKIKTDDILKIDIGTQSPEAAAIFNTDMSLRSDYNKESLIYNGYQVDIEGFINFPFLGKIYVADKTVFQLRDHIFKLINDNGILIDPSVDVKLLNSHFTILGEVNKPGRYDFLENNINIFEAIGMAGDLTINGERNSIKLLRDFDESKKVYEIDLTSTKFISDEIFQVLPGDIIIVAPNITRVKNAGIIGNSGTLLSLLSFILSSIIVITSS